MVLRASVVVSFRVLLSVGFLAGFAGQAAAHVTLMKPTPRHGGDPQKDAPCGDGESARTTKVTKFKGGETITVAWEETVPHPGHFRISFDDAGIDSFVDPTSYTDIQKTPVLPVLLDGIPRVSGNGMYEVQVTLPSTPCKTCTLQLIQIMTDKPPFGSGGGSDIYYQCADIEIEAAAIADAGVDSASSDGAVGGMGGNGGSAGGGGSGGATGGSSGGAGSGGTNANGGSGSGGAGGGMAAGGSGGKAGSDAGAAAGRGGSASGGRGGTTTDSGGCTYAAGARGEASNASGSGTSGLGLLLVGAVALVLRRRRYSQAS